MDSYFVNGMLFLGLVISLILLVLWLVTLFRNNAFKNFYPSSAWDLFKQFAAYAIIIFACTSFYYSYTLGLQTYLKLTYPTERLTAEHEIANDSDMFRSQTIFNYTLDERIIPQQLDTLYCEVDEFKMDTLQPYFKFKDAYYQFYSFRKMVVPTREGNGVNELSITDSKQVKPYNNVYQQDSLQAMSLRSVRTDSSITYFFKDKVVDLSKVIKTAAPSYYNYSNVFYDTTQVDNGYDYYEDYNYEFPEDNTTRINPSDPVALRQVNRNHALLHKKNPELIRDLLKKQLALLDNYGVKHNVTAASWFKMVYHPDDFLIKSILEDNEYAINDNEFLEEDATAFMRHAHSLRTKSYMETDELRRVFENLDDAHTTNIFEGSIHVFLWLSLFMAMLIFIFRTTGLRELLFSAVTSGVLSIIIGLICVLISYGAGGSGGEEYVFLYVPLIVGATIFLVTFLAFTSLRKLFSGILLNITFVYFVPWLFLIIGIISVHQSDVCRKDPNYYLEDFECMTILNQLGVLWSYIFVALTLLWVFIYAHLIIKWRSLPEK